MFTDAEHRFVGTDWEIITCRKGDALFSSGVTPVGENFAAEGVRRTISVGWVAQATAGDKVDQLRLGGEDSKISALNLLTKPGSRTETGRKRNPKLWPWRFSATILISSGRPVSGEAAKAKGGDSESHQASMYEIC